MIAPFHPLVRQFGPIEQIAFVPTDFAASIAFWTQTMGVGPFFMLEHIPLVDTRYRGEPTEIDSSVALGYWRDMQIELVQQHNRGRSAYLDSFDAGRDDLHHVLCQVNDLAAARAQCEAVGAVAVTEGKSPGAGEFIYFDMGGPGPLLEVVCLAPYLKEFFAFIREEARHWDGRDPVRRAPTEEEWRRA